MPKPAQLGPDWLVSLLVSWGKHHLDRESKSLGYYRVNPMLRDGIPMPARPFEPTGFSPMDYSDLETAMGQVETMQQLALARFCMPWRIRGIDAEHPDTNTRQWLALLRSGLEVLAGKLERKAA